MPGPRGAPVENFPVQSPEGVQLIVGNIVFEDDQKIHIAVNVEIPDRAGALKICANEIVAEQIPNPRDQLAQDKVQIGIARRLCIAPDRFDLLILRRSLVVLLDVR
jgi:hypothetical protein